MLVGHSERRHKFGETDGFYLLLEWPDRIENRLEQPLVTSADVLSDTGDTLIDCSSDALIRESSWSRSPLKEDQLSIELFSDSLGSYPADVWRWGAETTDPCTVNHVANDRFHKIYQSLYAHLKSDFAAVAELM